ncbi:MAG: NAD(P)H-dependent oxidoreductase [Polyangiaceae bacterium]
MAKLNAVAVTGNLTNPSKTVLLAKEILSALEASREFEARLIDLSQRTSALAGVVRREDASVEVQQDLKAVENADVVVAVTPVYRGSFTGVFKRFFDLIEQDSLQEVPVILAATGGGHRHTLVVEHSLRPLFAFFEAHTVPTAIYAGGTDFDTERRLSAEVQKRVRSAARQAVGLLSPRPVLRSTGQLHSLRAPV